MEPFTLQLAADPEFERKHPRNRGRFAPKGGGTAVAEPESEPGFTTKDEHGKYVGRLPAEIWPLITQLNAKSRDTVHRFGRPIDLVVQPETQQAALSEKKDHDPMIWELEPNGTRERFDAYARVTLMPDQSSGPGWLSIVPPWQPMADETSKAQTEYRNVRAVLNLLAQSGVPEDLLQAVKVSWGSELNESRARERGGSKTAMFAGTPEGAKRGWVTRKGGAPVERPKKGRAALPMPELAKVAARMHLPPERLRALLSETNELLQALQLKPLNRAPEPGMAPPGEDTNGLCYPWAVRFMLGTNRHDAVLVHGVLTPRLGPMEGQTMGHAWVEIGPDEVFDPVLQKFYKRADFEQAFRAQVERRYDHEQARRQMTSTLNYGPWHETAGTTNPARKRQHG